MDNSFCSRPHFPMSTDVLIVVAALDEADRITETIDALTAAFPGAPVFLADDGSTDATPVLARAAGATVVCSPRVIGKGQAMTLGVRAALSRVDFSDADARERVCARVDSDPDDSPPSAPFVDAGAEPPVGLAGSDPIVVLCDGDLGNSARELPRLVDAIQRGEADLAVAAFSTRATGGFGFALGFARWAVRRRCGLRTRAPLSGQRALRMSVLADVLPFAPGFAMEMGMTIDAVRAGHSLLEIDLPLSHRPTGRTLAGFAHRGHQLADFVRIYLSRR
jgi:glycosyltransferase involved in cell wall biosynthesis